MSSLSWNGYVLIYVDGKQVREHRKMWEDAYGPKSLMVLAGNHLPMRGTHDYS